MCQFGMGCHLYFALLVQKWQCIKIKPYMSLPASPAWFCAHCVASNSPRCLLLGSRRATLSKVSVQLIICIKIGLIRFLEMSH